MGGFLCAGMPAIARHFGFMEEPDVPCALAQVAATGLRFDPQQVPYFVNRTRVIPTDLPGMALWRERLYNADAERRGQRRRFLPSAARASLRDQHQRGDVADM